MKLQFEQQHLRLRINEAELAELQAGTVLLGKIVLSNALSWQLQLQVMDDASAWQADQSKAQLRLNGAELAGYVARLPCRDGLEYRFPLGAALSLAVSLEVDVRDSVRQRGLGSRRRDTEDAS